MYQALYRNFCFESVIGVREKNKVKEKQLHETSIAFHGLVLLDGSNIPLSDILTNITSSFYWSLGINLISNIVQQTLMDQLILADLRLLQCKGNTSFPSKHYTFPLKMHWLKKP